MNQPPLDYLLDASLTTLENFVLAMHERAAGIRKQIAADTDLLHECERNAEIAFMLIHHRDQLARMANLRQSVFAFGDALPEKPQPQRARSPYRKNYRKAGAA